MFGIGFPELSLIMAIALIVIGPDKLPEIARTLAKTLVDLKKTAEGLKDSFDEDDNPIKDIKPQLEDAARNFRETILDEETNTWKPPAELEDLKSVIDSTTVEMGPDPATPGNNKITDAISDEGHASSPPAKREDKTVSAESSAKKQQDNGETK